MDAVDIAFGKGVRPKCDIKGNIGASGKKIYHLPGDTYYKLTGINERAGERWFCSASAARRAGWRRSYL